MISSQFRSAAKPAATNVIAIKNSATAWACVELAPNVHLTLLMQLELNLERPFTTVIVADANCVRNFVDKDLTVTDLSGSRGRCERRKHLVESLSWYDNFQLQFRQQVYRLFLAPVNFLMTFLPSMTANLDNGHPLDTNALKGLFHIVEFERSYDRFNLLHASFRYSMSDSGLARVRMNRNAGRYLRLRS